MSFAKYYDIIFQFRDIKKECDFLEYCFKNFAERKVKKILDLACGTGSHAIELAKRGYDVVGIDINKDMLNLAKQKAKNLKIRFFKADISNFNLKEKFDAAICMNDSINYLTSNEKLIKHFNLVYKHLNKRGIYIIETFHPKEILGFQKVTLDSWKEKRGNIEVKIDYKELEFDWNNQILKRKWKFEIKEGNKRKAIEEIFEHRVIFPQEFYLFSKLSKFKLIKLFGDFFKEIDNTKNSWRIIVVLRK
ncbi:MAG: class I SAM-dependent methyltransferase [Candidatus Aenigmatarchaeota archaeon]